MSEYADIARSLGPSKRLGQNFLVNGRIAKSEANFGIGKVVVEIGPGLGVLTKELCRQASRVIAIEKDKRLYDYLSGSLKAKNLELINADFFDVSGKASEADILISNIPYNISSKVLFWLAERNLPALLCLQEEFVDHMLAEPGSRTYSKLSVVASLQFDLKRVFDVSAANFYPQPRVNSSVVLLKPKRAKLDRRALEVLSLIMMHKKKKVRNALIDSSEELRLPKDEVRELADSIRNHDARPFQLSPEDILDVSERVAKLIRART